MFKFSFWFGVRCTFYNQHVGILIVIPFDKLCLLIGSFIYLHSLWYLMYLGLFLSPSFVFSAYHPFSLSPPPPAASLSVGLINGSVFFFFFLSSLLLSFSSSSSKSPMSPIHPPFDSSIDLEDIKIISIYILFIYLKFAFLLSFMYSK